MNGTNQTATAIEHGALPMPPAPANLARVEQHAAPLVRHADGPLHFTPEQRQMIRDTFANGASESEFEVLFEISKARRLNPLLRQCHYVKRWDSQKKRDVWSVQVSIDGLRAIAERTGLYDGQDEPEYVHKHDAKTKKHRLTSCKLKVYKKGISRPFVGVCVFDEYAQKKKDGALTQFWREKPHVMIAKCAEAAALRKAFPEDTAGLYVAEEMPEEPREEHQPANSARAANGQEITNDGEVIEDKPRDEDAIVTALLDKIDAIRSKADEHAVVTEIMRSKLSNEANDDLRNHLKKHKAKAAAASSADRDGADQ